MATYNECQNVRFLDEDEARRDWWNNFIGGDWQNIFRAVISEGIVTETPDFFNAIKELTELTLDNVAITNLEPIKFLRKLKVLQIRDCQNLYYLQIEGNIGLPNLTTLLVENCQNLQAIQITLLGHLQAITLTNLPVLNRLRLWGCNWFTELNLQGVLSIATLLLGSCTNLQNLNLANFINLTELNLVDCRGLRSLNLENCGNLTPNALNSILTYPLISQLTELNCRGTQIINNPTLQSAIIANTRCNYIF